MSWIDNIAEYLLSERPKLTSKALLVLFSMFIIYFVNSVLGFSYYYSNEKKLEQVRKLNEMISDEKSDSTARMFAIKLRREIIERQDCIRTFIAYWNNITFSSRYSC